MYSVRYIIGHDGKAYGLTGPELLSFGEMMQKMSAVIGKPLQHVDVPVATARDGMIGAGYPPEHSDGLLVYFAAVKAGKMFVQPTVKQLLGRPGHSFDDYLRANAATLNT